eukprot:755998-Pelagomonas_calceolata.AAC.5
MEEGVTLMFACRWRAYQVANHTFQKARIAVTPGGELQKSVECWVSSHYRQAHTHTDTHTHTHTHTHIYRAEGGTQPSMPRRQTTRLYALEKETVSECGPHPSMPHRRPRGDVTHQQQPRVFVPHHAAAAQHSTKG